jgi:hypothetical protein
MILRFIPLQEIQHYKCQSTTSAITILWILEPCHSVRLEPMFTSKVVRLIVIGPMNLVKGTEVIILTRFLAIWLIVDKLRLVIRLGTRDTRLAVVHSQACSTGPLRLAIRLPICPGRISLVVPRTPKGRGGLRNWHATSHHYSFSCWAHFLSATDISTVQFFL